MADLRQPKPPLGTMSFAADHAAEAGAELLTLLENLIIECVTGTAGVADAALAACVVSKVPPSAANLPVADAVRFVAEAAARLVDRGAVTLLSFKCEGIDHSIYYPGGVSFSAKPASSVVPPDSPPPYRMGLDGERKRAVETLVALLDSFGSFCDREVTLRVIHSFCPRCGERAEGHRCLK